MKKTPIEWLADPKFTGIVVLDPDGWDRKDFEKSWRKKIDEEEFTRRLMQSTIVVNRPQGFKI